MWRWEVCLVVPESRQTAQVIPCENLSSLILSHRNQAQIRAFHHRDWILWCKWLPFVSRCLPGRMEPAGQGIKLSNPFSWLIQLAGSSREHPLSHHWMLFYLFNVLMLSHTFTLSLLSIVLSSGLQEYYHRSGLSRGFRYTLLVEWVSECVRMSWTSSKSNRQGWGCLPGQQGCT